MPAHTLLIVRFASALRAPRSHDGCPALRRAMDSIMHRRPPQRPSLGSGLFCPGPSALNRPHPPHSQAHRDVTAWRLIRDAFAVRERRGDPQVVPGFHCTFLPDMPSSPTSGRSTSISRNFDADIGLRRMTTGSALPTLPQSVPRGRSISWRHWFASATACQIARPPVRIRLERPAFGDFYFQAFNGSVSLSVAGYNYNSDWTPLLAGLSPAGMAASLAARSIATDAYSASAEQCPHCADSDHSRSRGRLTLCVESRCGAVALGRTYLLPPLSSGGALMVPPWLRFHIPLIEPDRQIWRPISGSHPSSCRC